MSINKSNEAVYDARELGKGRMLVQRFWCPQLPVCRYRQRYCLPDLAH